MGLADGGRDAARDATPPDASEEVDGAAGDSTVDADAGLDATDAEASAVDVADASAIDASDASEADAGDSDAGDGTTVTSADGGAPRVRFAHLAPDLGPSVDFCIAAAGQAFGAPYLQGQGLAAGLAYAQVSEYAPAPAGAIAIRAVAAGSSSCALALPGIADLTLPASGSVTVALLGTTADGGNALTLRAYPDDDPPATPRSVTIQVRVIHAAPFAPPIDLQIGSGGYVVPQEVATPYGQTLAAATPAAGGAAPDANGYIQLGIQNAQMTAKIAGSEVTSFNAHSYWSLVTGFLVGIAGSASVPLGFVACNDGASPQGHLSSCQVTTGSPPSSTLRFVNLAPDAQARDVCVGVDGHVFGGTLAGPVLGPVLTAAGVSGGMAPFQLTGIVTTVPQGTDISLRYVAPGGDCSQPGLTSWLAGFAMDSINRVESQTIALTQSAFAPPSYLVDYGISQALPGTTTADVGITNDDREATNQNIDVFVTPAGGLEQTLLTDWPWGSGTGFDLDPGTYDVRVADTTSAATLYSASGVSLPAGSFASWIWIHDAAGHGDLVRCDLSGMAPSALTTCDR
jgi:hypothetical protein